MAKQLNTPEARKALLTACRNIAIIGLSSKPNRPSYRVAEYLIGAGYNVLGVHPHEKEVLGRPVYPSLAALADAHPGWIQIVDVFRNADDVPPLVPEAIAVGARALWLQLGIVNEAAAAAALAGGLDVVMDRCIKIDHAELFDNEEADLTCPTP